MADNCKKKKNHWLTDQSDNPMEDHIISRMKFFAKISDTSTGLTTSVSSTSR